MDRIDLQVTVPRTPAHALGREGGGEPSARVRGRVQAGRALQLDRQGTLNSALRGADLRQWAPLEPAARAALERWAEERALSARGFHRSWRVARTLADLEQAGSVAERHVLEALGYRLADGAG
jgi:magnesium chelatase family protein